MKQISNLKRSLLAYKGSLKLMEIRIDNALKEIDNLYSKKASCEKCFSGNVRVMKGGRTFCRACGFEKRGLGDKI